MFPASLGNTRPGLSSMPRLTPIESVVVVSTTLWTKVRCSPVQRGIVQRAIARAARCCCLTRVKHFPLAFPRLARKRHNCTRNAVTRWVSQGQPPLLTLDAVFSFEQLACGEKHRAQDLLLSWPAINYSSGCPSSALNQEEDPSTVTMSTTVDGETEDKRGNSIAGEPSFPEPLAALHCRGGVAFPPPPLALPRHTFVFAEPCPTTARKSTSSDNDITEGKAAPVGAAGNSRPENNSGPPPIALVGDVRNRRQKHRQERRQARPGVALAFHSSSLPLVRSEDQPRTPLRREQPRQSRLHAAPEDVADCPAAGPGSAGFASTVTVPESQPIAAAERVTRQADGEDVAAAKDDRKRLSYHAEDVCLGSVEASDGCPVSLVPGRFGYSLGKPFHSQRVAAVKFITPGAPTTRLEAGRSGFSPNLRLITGEKRRGL